MLIFVREIVERKKVILTKIILQRKLNRVCQTVRYKAHLVAQGFRQVEGLDFMETFVPDASLSSVHVILSITAAKGLQYIKWIWLQRAWARSYRRRCVFRFRLGCVTGLFLSNENTIGPAVVLLSLVLREASRGALAKRSRSRGKGS